MEIGPNSTYRGKIITVELVANKLKLYFDLLDVFVPTITILHETNLRNNKSLFQNTS